ncbi:S9 family peptidase [Wenzhouxiangella sp. XN24]|uniref:S9 family peptidase n=1 Tax=Wenzhouxiangella sp. XN24 TaxID=2713569 RepID=UPI0013EAD3CD|nr:S9 family peptidase [Wenzhouxiangella sp. XN24]NGX15704.1 S9 family peptidase [Wenzhouxiangella sp. XN24]
MLNLFRLLALFLGALAVVAPAVAADPQRPITHEDLWLMPRVGAPEVSPDGRWAVVAVTRPAYDSDEQASHLWLVPTDGSESPRQLTFARGGESGTSWSPDSKRIAFTTQREGDEAPQVYVLDLAVGGEARRITSISTGARQPVFSPDGRRIAFVSDVHPDSRSDADSQRISEEEKARKHEVLTYTGFPIRNWDRWRIERQPRLMVQGLDEREARDLLAGSDLVALPGYDGRPTPGGSELDARWTPDGESLVFVASTNRHRAAFAFTHTDLWHVAATGGEPRRLTGGSIDAEGDNWGSPTFSPDGRSLYATRTPRTDRVFNAARLVRLDWPTASVAGEIEMPEKRRVLRFAVAPNSREVFILAENAGHVQLYRAKVRDGRARPAFDMEAGIYSDLSISSRGRRPVLLARFESSVSPGEVVRIDLGHGGHEALTSFTAEHVAPLDLQPPEHFWFDSERGTPIHSLLVRPAGFDPERRYPLLVLIHGGPHGMFRDYFHLRWNYHLLAGSDYVVLATNYTGSTGFGEAFAQAIQGDPLRGPAEEINQAADVAIERFAFIDGERQCAAGASYGGHLANWLQGTTDRYRCLVSHAGLVNLMTQWGTSDAVYHREMNIGGPPWEVPALWEEQNPIRFAAEWSTPVLVTIGQLDYRVPINNVLEYWTALQRQQVESRLLVYPNENHWILNGHNSRHFYGEIATWLQRWLLEGEG